MTKLALCMTAVFLLCGLGSCTREDGLPDPPFRPLVPCNVDAGTDEPLACPPTGADLGTTPHAADAGHDA